jgi:hypothetical protein
MVLLKIYASRETDCSICQEKYFVISYLWQKEEITKTGKYVCDVYRMTDR